MPDDTGVNPNTVITKLRDKIGDLVTENAMLETALEEAWEKIRKLEADAVTDAEAGDLTDVAPKNARPKSVKEVS